MQNYLEQLIADMRSSATRVPQSPIPNGTFDPDYMLELEESEYIPMSQLLGLSIEMFPESDRLTMEQLELLTGEFMQLWSAYKFWPEFPDGLPAKRKYELMREQLEEKIQYWPGDWVQHFEFCDYDPENCHFGKEYCRCKDFDHLNIPDTPNSNDID
jgi:hypothetical protein